MLRLQNRISMLEEDVKRECNRADIANSKLINAESEYMRKINELTRKEEELRKNLIEVNRDQSKQLSPTSLKDKLAKEEETYSQEEELRAKVKKQMELKYSNELAKLQDYVDELEKKCDALEERATNKGAS